jgi:hypothetical protein
MLFVADTTPPVAVAPLSHVTAPAFSVDPLSHLGLATTTFPLLSPVTPAPTSSPGCEPTRLFSPETTPVDPLSPSPHVTAPAPFPQPVLATT